MSDAPTVPRLGITKEMWENYAERVDILTNVIGGVLSQAASNPMIATMAGDDFVRDVQNMLARLAELQPGIPVPVTESDESGPPAITGSDGG